MERKLKFESRIINPILRLIKNNQEYLTKPENLPQLAKLGYIYNTLWYSGRHASYDGIIDKNQNEDNAKYKIEMCEPINDTIENYIYDAWGMHVSNEYGPSWDEFKTTVKGGIPLTELDKKILKPNKTFDEWVEILTNKNYRYSSLYPDRSSVASTLLCCIGTEYGYKDGYVFKESGGADQDECDYGDWKNCTFRKDIQKKVDEIMTDDEVKTVMEYVTIKKQEHDDKKMAEEIRSFGMPYKQWLEKNKRFLSDFGADEIEKREWYPICEYSIITKLNKKSHPSYITAALEICEDIVTNPPEIKKNWNKYQTDQRNNMIKFAENFIKKYKN